MKIKHKKCGNVEEIPDEMKYASKNIYCNECEVYIPSDEWKEVNSE